MANRRPTILEALANEIAKGSDLSVSQPTPSVPDPKLDMTSVVAAVKALKAAADVREGRAGSAMDRSLTLRDLVDVGAASFTLGGQTFGSTGGGGISVGGGATGGTIPGEDYLTSIPAPTSVDAAGGFSEVFVTWDQVQFANFAYTEVWRATTNVLGSATLIGETTSLMYTDTSGTISTLYYYWARTVGFNPDSSPLYGAFSTSASGGIQLIGNVNLGPLIIEAKQLSQGTYAGVNLAPNPGAEDGFQCWEVAESTGSGFTAGVDTSRFYGGTQSFKLTRGAGGVALGCQTIFVIPGETYAVNVSLMGDAADTHGLWIRVEECTSAPASNYVDGSNRTSFTDLTANSAIPSTWTPMSYSYTVPPGVYCASLAVYLWNSASTATTVWFDDVMFGRQITAVSLAAGSIAVGTAAIENGAIVNAMIANATIDNAKIANLNADKIIAGALQSGSYIESTSYVLGASGWIINSTGAAEFNSVTVRGTIVASGGTIGGAVISTSYVQSSGYVAGSSGWKLDNASGQIFAAAVSIQDSSGTRIFNTQATGTSYVLQIGSLLWIKANGDAFFGGKLALGSASTVVANGTGSTVVVHGSGVGFLDTGIVTLITSGTVTNTGNPVTLSYSVRTASGQSSSCGVGFECYPVCDGSIILGSGIYPINRAPNMQGGVSGSTWGREDSFGFTLNFTPAAGTHSYGIKVQVFFFSTTGGLTTPSSSSLDLDCSVVMQENLA